MRKLKFRAWDKDNEEMVYFKFGDLDDGFVGSEGLSIDNKGYKREEAPVMQYTGLHDKSGKEIYEGDVVKEPVDWDRIVVTIENGNWIPEIDYDRDSIIYSEKTELEITGNIYENPELIKKK